MEKIQELVKDGKLSKTLMADKKFVKDAKKIFKDENIEIDDKKLDELMNQIESQLKTSNILNDKELEEISGGSTSKFIGRAIVKTVSVATGVAVMGALGASGGSKIGGIAADSTIRDKGSKYELSNGEIMNNLSPDTGAGRLAVESGKTGGAVVGFISGAAAGAQLGRRFARCICENAGLYEE